MKAWCPNHWATREFPVFVYFTKKKKKGKVYSFCSVSILLLYGNFVKAEGQKAFY